VSLLVAICALVLLAAVIAVVSGPLRAARQREDEAGAERRELQAAREAKYRELRDAELDYRTGKLSDEDYQAVVGTLRAEALAILDRLEALRSPESAAADRQD